MDQFKHLMERIEGRMATDTQILRDVGKLVKKVSTNICQLKDHTEVQSQPTENVQNCDETERVVLEYNGKNLLTLGGVSDSDKCKRIAAALFTNDELKKYVIDPRRAPPTRQSADEERTELYRKAVSHVLGISCNETRYRSLLTLVNQVGLNLRQAETEDKENNAPSRPEGNEFREVEQIRENRRATSKHGCVEKDVLCTRGPESRGKK